MTTPPTGDDARRLLAEAAATVDVDDTAPMSLTGLPEPRPRRWPVLAAAAAVVVAIGAGYLASQQLGGDPQLAPTPASDGVVSSEPTTDSELPSLIGFTDDEAIRVLEERGYPVKVHVRPDGCDVAGIVTGTKPAAGTPMNPGDPVTIHVVGQPDVIVDCVGEIPWLAVWDVVRAAQGVADPVPSITEQVLGLLAAELAQRRPVEGLPRIIARWAFDTDPCHASAGGAWDLRIWVGVPVVDGSFCPALSFLIALDDNGRVRSVAPEGSVITEKELEANLNRLSAAGRFVAWARGESVAPKFADRVRVMFFGGAAFGHPGWTDEPEDRTTYAGCSGLGFPDCGEDPVALLVRQDGPVMPSEGRSTCADGGEVPERFADAPEDVVRIEPREPASCRNAWAVELWIAEDGVIYGVNQAGG